MRRPPVLIPIALLCAGLSAQAETLEALLARMDKAAGSFRSLSGGLRKVSHTAVINDTSQESGTVRIKRISPRETRILVEISEPEVKSYVLRDRKVEIYYPKIATVQEWDLGKQKDLMDQFLLLGFGTSGRDLQRGYALKIGGADELEGRKTSRLELIPKSPKVREHLSKAELWISETEGRTVQQKFYQPSGDYMLVVYADVEWNPELPDSALALKLPKSVKREYPQR